MPTIIPSWLAYSAMNSRHKFDHNQLCRLLQCIQRWYCYKFHSDLTDLSGFFNTNLATQPVAQDGRHEKDLQKQTTSQQNISSAAFVYRRRRVAGNLKFPLELRIFLIRENHITHSLIESLGMKMLIQVEYNDLIWDELDWSKLNLDWWNIDHLNVNLFNMIFEREDYKKRVHNIYKFKVFLSKNGLHSFLWL